MLGKYHLEITKRSLASFFSTQNLAEILRANLQQDSFLSFFGVEARRHVCDCRVEESLAYVEEEHAQIAALAHEAGQERRQRAALGRLLHTVQDLYAHTNYVALWCKEGCKEMGGKTLAVNDPAILDHPYLQTAQWSTWRDPLYYIPLVGKLLRRVWLPANSHEAMNLDSPKGGPSFHVAVAMAEVRTVAEYARAVAAIREVGGAKALARFHGTLSCPISQHSPLQA